MTQPKPVSDAEAQELASLANICEYVTTSGENLRRLLADRARDKERLARFEAALADTEENVRALGEAVPFHDYFETPYEDIPAILAHLRRVAQGEAQP